MKRIEFVKSKLQDTTTPFFIFCRTCHRKAEIDPFALDTSEGEEFFNSHEGHKLYLRFNKYEEGVEIPLETEDQEVSPQVYSSLEEIREKIRFHSTPRSRVSLTCIKCGDNGKLSPSGHDDPRIEEFCKTHAGHYVYLEVAGERIEVSEDGGNDDRVFPLHLMSGVAGDFAKLYSSYIEAPAPLLYFGFLTCLGSILAKKLKLNSEISYPPRLYTLCLGPSATSRKSTSINTPTKFFSEYFPNLFKSCLGVGSAEGLQAEIKDVPNGCLLMCLDEMKAFVAKCKIEGSVLLPCVNTLFNETRYGTRTKNGSIRLDEAHLSILAASTIETYQKIWTEQFIHIGFINRIFIVPATGERKYPIPQKVPIVDKNAIFERTSKIIERVGDGLEMKVSKDAEALYNSWYLNPVESSSAARLDTYATRFMPLLALNDQKDEVDVETVEKVIGIMNWQLVVRDYFDPIDAISIVSRMECNIRRNVKRKPMGDRELKTATNAYREGIWAYEMALKNLSNGRSPELRWNPQIKKYEYIGDQEGQN